ncbi:MAG: lysozyme inhibitor LprI family protein [Pseudomonadota bacterium]
MKSFVSVSLLLAFLASGHANAQALSVDASVVEACFASAPAEMTQPDCIGAATEACTALPGGGTTLGISQCLSMETAAWDKILNQQYTLTRGHFTAFDDGGDPPLQQSLLQAQRAWIAFRDAECGFAYDRNRQGTIRVIVGANCLLRLTAQRAIELRDMRGPTL